jgi:hypothetical protein
MNIDKYIGLPYQENGRTWQGVDCWGLARLFYKHNLNIELPDYSDLYTGSWDEQVTKLINHHKDSWQQVETPVAGDLCLFNIYGEPAHVGVYVGDNKFLHSRDGLDSVIESLNSAVWNKRFQGFFRYQVDANTVQVLGAPHPLKITTAVDIVTEGCTLAEVVALVNEKYSVNPQLVSRLVLMLDGVPIPQDKWATTVVQGGQQVSYRVLAQGRGTGRMLVMLAVFIAVQMTIGDPSGTFAAKVASTLGVKAATAATIITAASMTATAILQNAVAPIRPPSQNDPGTPNQLNLFNGSSNQANRFGAIPIVLGKVRYVGLLGATPYTKTLTDTNILNLLIIWGFGPLQIDDICVGATNLESAFYDADTSKGLPRPYILTGDFAETTQETADFNKRYPEDVEQVYAQQGELVNNAQEGTNVWREVTFLQPSTGIDIALTFPEGLRAIKTTGGDAGKVQETTTTVEIQVAKVGENFGSTPQYQAGVVSSNPATPSSVTAYSKTLTGASISTTDYDGNTVVSQNLFKWYVLCLTPQGEIVELAGTPTDNKDQNPNQQLQTLLTDSSLGNLVDSTQTFTRLPTIPTDYVKLHSICIHGNDGLVETINHLTALNNQGYNGFTLTTQNITVDMGDYIQPTGSVLVTVSGGTYYPQAVPQGGVATTETHFVTRVNQLVLSGTQTAATPVSDTYNGWSDFLKQNGVWVGSNTTIDLRGSFTVTDARDFYFEAAVDDEAQVYVDGAKLFDIPKQSWRTTATGRLRLEAGTHQVQIVANNSEGGKAAVAFKVTSKQGTSDAPLKALGTFLTFGTNDIYTKRKDPFNHVHSLRGLEEAVYKLRVRRVDNDDPENVEGLRKYHKVALLNATCYNSRAPLQKLPRGNLARTVIQVQSSNKVNGSVDGINALVQTLTYDWNSTTDKWEPFRATNNPASLFLYVLAHPANAYRVARLESNTFIEDIAQKVDLAKIQEWHEFCSTKNTQTGKPVLSYNGVITGTISVMDALRDICAAGMASPIFIDGKWSVVIDKARPYVVQHFTPHNSWGFESTKALPKIPDAFRVTIQDESDAYQTKELIVYNYAKNASNAEVFEELQLPGITNSDQAKFFAKWHLAQLKLRPEIYTINTDFEYLVCNRGDLVRVTHDVPLWGSGSGRIKDINGNQLTLTEDIYLETGKQYRILIRTNVKSGTPGLSSVYKNIQAVTTTGYYSTVTCSTAITVGDGLEVDNLFIIGELNQETQELIVLSVEPSTNLTARIVLTDYSSEIYSLNLASEFPSVTYNANITATTGVIVNTITESPVLNSILSNRGTSQQIATGTYQTGALISFSNPAGLTNYAVFVQMQLIRADEQFNGSSPANIQSVRKETGNYTFTGLTTGIMYKVRIRYADALGTVYGPWTNPTLFVAGAAGAETVTNTLKLTLEGTYIVATPEDFDLPSDFKTYEYRIVKDTGTEDFWELDPTDPDNEIQVTQSIVEGRFNLLDQPSPRLSETGITYKVACRVVTRTNEYSQASAVDTIVVTTIKYAT